MPARLMPGVQGGIGYTPAEALRLKRKLELEMAKLEDCAARLRRIVPDADPDRHASRMSIDLMLEEFREITAGLSATVDRRTRG